MTTNITDTQKPTVAHLRSPYLSFSETFIYNMLKNTRHHRPIVLAMRTENKNLFPFRDVYVVRIPRHLRALWQRFLRFQSSILKYAPWYPAYMWAIHKHEVDLLHAHFGTTGYFAWPLKRIHGLPLVSSFYGADISRVPKQPRWPGRYRSLFASGEHFTTVSELMKGQLIDLGCPADKITVVHTGIDLDQFAYQPRLEPMPMEPVKFLMVARFIEKKGIEYAIKAFAQVHRTYPQTEFRLIGDGPRRSQIERLIEDLGVGNAVKLLGFQPHAVFMEETKRCHILLQPSVTARNGDQEGAPVTLMEAQAAGMPVVATLHAAIPEEVLDGETGFLVPERDADALAARMRFLIEHPDIWNELGHSGHQHIKQHYNVVVETKKLEEVYANAIARNGDR